MSRPAMNLLMAICAMVIGVSGLVIQRQLAPAAVAPAPPPPAAAPPPPPTPPPALPAAPATAASPLPESGPPSEQARRRARTFLVGTWELDEAGTRAANGTLSSADKKRLEAELRPSADVLTEYREDGTVRALERRRLQPLGTSRWALDGLTETDALLTFVHDDQTRVQLRVMTPAYNEAATQRAEFVLVWRRQLDRVRTDHTGRVQLQLSAGVGSSGVGISIHTETGAQVTQAQKSADAAAPRAFESLAAQKRWDGYKKSAEEKYGAQPATADGCTNLMQCVRVCAGDPMCESRCRTTHACVAPLYTR